MSVGVENLFGEYGPLSAESDVVYTPDWCAADMVRHFKPRGRVLEPCKGGGAFMRYLPADALWCEITEGRDFFAWSEPVDWIVTNPPYNIVSQFLSHARTLASNIVFLMPAQKMFSGYGQVRSNKGWGGMAEIRWYGTGSRLNFPMGNAIAAIHWRRGHQGWIKESFYEDEVAAAFIPNINSEIPVASLSAGATTKVRGKPESTPLDAPSAFTPAERA